MLPALLIVPAAGLSAGPGAPQLRLDLGASPGPTVLPPALVETPASAETAAIHVVFLRGPPRELWIDALRAAGVAALQYVPESAFIVLASAQSVEVLRSLPFVERVDVFPIVRKLAPAVREMVVTHLREGGAGAAPQPSRPGFPPVPTASGAASPGQGGSTSDRGAVDLIFELFDTGDAAAFRRMLTRAGGREIYVTRLPGRVHVRAAVRLELVASAARWPTLFRVELFPRIEMRGERAAVISVGGFSPEARCITPGHEAWLEQKGVNGQGIVLHLMDDGIEQGDASGLAGTAHPDLLGAIAGVDNATSDPLADCRAGHGSLNASLAVGRAATGVTDADGFLLGLGVAPSGKVFATKIFNNLGRFDTGARSFAELVGRAAQRGAAISSNSWGASVFGEYDALAAEFDALVRDALPDEGGSQPMLFIFAAGNEGDDVPPGTSSISSPASAKNVIAVGAAESCDTETVDGCGLGPLDADSIRDVVQFSSRGPNADGRLGPALLAPGTHAIGVASTAVGYDGVGLCDPFWPEGQVLYARGSGTSHGCPLVAGAAGLFHEWCLEKNGILPSPALVRAALAAAAHDLAGGDDGFGRQVPHVPNSVQGWGRIAIDELIPDTQAVPSTLYFDEPTILSDTGDVWETIVFPIDATKPLKVTLAWSDPPAVPGAQPALINDLDLEVESAGAQFRGNHFVEGFAAPGGDSDHLNNLEGVFLERPGPVVKVRVRAARIAGDGAPEGDANDQDFAIVVVGGTMQSSRGVASFRRPSYSCDAIVGVVVSDIDLKGESSIQVVVSSSASGVPVVGQLTEVNPGSGVFDGAISLGKNPGQLLVQDGGTITVRYIDSNDGSGLPAETVAIAQIDCKAPEISGVTVGALSETTATIAWSSSEPAAGRLLYGSECALATTEVGSALRSESHEVQLSGLTPGTRYFFTLRTTDAVGNVTEDDRGGLCYSFSTSAPVCGFQDDLEPAPVDGWTHFADQAADDWAPAEFTGARSPPHAWHATGFDGFKDASLVSPPLDIEAGDIFKFWHTFQLERGYDGAVLEISKDGGAEWSDLGPYITRGGYVDVVSGNPLGDRMAWTGQRNDAMTEVAVDLTSCAGPARRLRFRLACDSSFADGFGWFIDDVAVCRVINRRATLALDRSVYRCGDTVHVRVDDLDLVGTGTLNVQLSTPSIPAPVFVALPETLPQSGAFSSDVRLDGSVEGLQASDGDVLIVEYEDQDNGLGDGPSSVQRSASIDCRAPQITGVRLVEVFDDEVTLAFETSEPAETEVLAGPDCGTPTLRASPGMGGTSHVVTLTQLDESIAYRYKITARDEAGNSVVEDAGGQCRLFHPAAVRFDRQDFDDGAPSWKHGAALGEDSWRLEETPLARSPPDAWHVPGADRFSDTSLFSPHFTVPPGALLAFWHTFEFEPGFDGAVIEILSDPEGEWTDLGMQIRRGGYQSTLVAPNPLAGRRAWSGGVLGSMTRVVVDISDWAGQMVQIRFRAVTDASVAAGGWYLDRLELLQSVKDEARLTLDRTAYPCVGNVLVRVLDAGRSGQSGITVDVASTSEILPEKLQLTEALAGTGIYEGLIALGVANAPGVLLVKDGDALWSSYIDDSGGGPPVDRTAIASVDCLPPSILNVVAVYVGVDSAVIAWSTDEPTTGVVEIGDSCGDFLESIPDSLGESHEVLLPGLSEGTTYFFRVRATDRAGNSTIDDAGGGCRSFRSRVTFVSFEDALEPGARFGWDDGGRWSVAESPLARSGTHVWRIAEGGKPQEASLTLPPFPTAQGRMLEFWHTFELREGSSGGVIEGSEDGGETWRDLDRDILEGGYRSLMLPGSVLQGRRAWSGGRLGPLTRVRVRLDSLRGAMTLVRLRWASQGVSDEGSWLVDDARVLRSVGQTALVGFGASLFGCSSTIPVLLADSDLVGTATQLVQLTSPLQPDPRIVLLTEASPGFFRGSVEASTQDAPGALRVADGAAITVSYVDTSDDSGQALSVEGSAMIDCTPPTITGIRVGEGGFATAEVLWETSEPARSRVNYGERCDALARVAPSPSVTMAHRAVLEDLSPDVPVLARVEATDLAGNTSSTEGCVSFSISGTCSFEDSFEPPREGWSHTALLGLDDWRIEEFASSHSPTKSFHGANPGLTKDSVLVTPPFDVVPGMVFSFWHTFELEENFDGARLEISEDGGASWADLGSAIFAGKYNGVISLPTGPVPAWTGGTIQDMNRVSVALDKFVGPERRIRFRLLCDDSVGTQGWFIDDVSVCTFSPKSDAARFARGNCNADGVVNLSDAVFLLNFLFLGNLEPRCQRACDVDRNNALNLTDAIFLLDYLFRGGRTIEPPLSCEVDLQPSSVGCETPACTAQ